MHGMYENNYVIAFEQSPPTSTSFISFQLQFRLSYSINFALKYVEIRVPLIKYMNRFFTYFFFMANKQSFRIFIGTENEFKLSIFIIDQVI